MKKTAEKGPKKMADFEPKNHQNGGSVAKLYFNLNGGMRVGGGGFRRCLFWLYIVEKRNLVGFVIFPTKIWQ